MGIRSGYRWRWSCCPFSAFSALVLKFVSAVAAVGLSDLTACWQRSSCSCSVRAILSASMWPTANFSLLLTKLDWRVFGTFFVSGIPPICDVTGSVNAGQERSALAAFWLVGAVERWSCNEIPIIRFVAIA